MPAPFKNQKLFYSLISGLSAALSVYVALQLHLNAPYWSAISVVAICSPGAGITINKGIMRIIATFCGALLGLYMANLTINSFNAFVLSCFFVFAISQYLSYHTQYKYIFVLGAATFFMVNASVINDVNNIYYIAIWRFSEVSIGVFVSSLLILFSFNQGIRNLIASEEIVFFNKKKFDKTQNQILIIKESIKNGLGVIVALFIWMSTASPGGLQGLISALAIGQPKTDAHNISTVLHQAKNRFLGCLVGGIVGLICLYWIQFNLVVLLTLLLLFTSFFTYITFASKHYTYFGLQANVAFILTIIQTDTVTNSIIPAITRLCGISIGIFSIMIVHLLVWPRYRVKERCSVSL